MDEQEKTGPEYMGELPLGDDEIRTISLFVMHPSVALPEGSEITFEDVWGSRDDREDMGMIVASGYGERDTCPVWGDKLPYKSVTVQFEYKSADDILAVIHWLEYQHGTGSVSGYRNFGDGRIALRSDYMCW